MNRFNLVLALLLVIGCAQGVCQKADDLKKPKTEQQDSTKSSQDESFGDYVKKAGKSIWNRLKERFRLEEAGENLKQRGQQIFGDRKEENPKPTPPKTKQDSVRSKESEENDN